MDGVDPQAEPMEPNIKVEDFEWRNRPDKVDQVYEFTKTLGRGSHAKVKLGREKKTGEMVAIKVMEKKSSKFEYDTLGRNDTWAAAAVVVVVVVGATPTACVQRRRDRQCAAPARVGCCVMKAVDHPHCIKLYDVFEDKEKCYLVQELASGGELFERVIANGAFSEKDAASLIKQLFEAVGYLHSSGIVHRDLKPENLLMKSGDAASPHYNILKLADFGLSTFQAEMTQATVRDPLQALG
ncbi:kinase-like domain-containing protein [Baffinella frigidus]|nr:kinase-like domain-containing protein [Cryptophyta sp. CCMP2293]